MRVGVENFPSLLPIFSLSFVSHAICGDSLILINYCLEDAMLLFKLKKKT